LDPTSGGELPFYRVTARGVGGTTNAVVIVQSIFKGGLNGASKCNT